MVLPAVPQTSKVTRLADAIGRSLSRRDCAPGDPLPSINLLSLRYNVSRDTVFKAFSELKRRGVVESVPAKGYFVSRGAVEVLLLLDRDNARSSELYETLVGELPANCNVDLRFHRCDGERFRRIVTESIGRYNYYLVMDCRDDAGVRALDAVDPAKLLLLDATAPDMERFAYACRCETTLYDCLEQGRRLFARYDRIRLVLSGAAAGPTGCRSCFERFCRDCGFVGEVLSEMEEPRAGTAYLLADRIHLIGLVKAVRRRGFALGREVGAVALDDEPMFEVVGDGITAISTDARAMGRLASEFVRTRRRIQTYVPARLVVRSSL